MGRARGYNAGGGQSSLGYLLGGGGMSNKEQNPQDQKEKSENVNNDKPNTLPVDTQIAAGIDGGNLTNNPDTLPANPRIAAGVHGADLTNNYHRADGQNRGNFITDRPSTRVHYSPGGCSSLGYLFGGSDGGGGN